MSNPLRPRLRPTLSRKTKYVGIAPTAQKKLGREARRGSHDLRKLVGHANFLDVLVEQLHVDEEDADVSTPTEESKPEPDRRELEREEEEEEKFDDESDSDEWTSEEEDDSNDEEHMLFRSPTIRPPGHSSSHVNGEVPVSPDEDGDDYFSQSNHGEAVIRLQENRLEIPRNLLQDGKNGSISVVVSDSLDELMDTLRNGGDEQTAVSL